LAFILTLFGVILTDVWRRFNVGVLGAIFWDTLVDICRFRTDLGSSVWILVFGPFSLKVVEDFGSVKL
jgi:hypothetical protein